MSSSRFSLFFVQKRAFRIFNTEVKQDKYSTKKLLRKCFSISKTSTFNLTDENLSSLPYYGHVTFWIDFLTSNKKVNLNNFGGSFADYLCIFCGTTIFDSFR